MNFTAWSAPDPPISTTWSEESWNGLTTFARSTPLNCFGEDVGRKYDLAILGAPFDTATSFRPGARFGPNGIRQGSRRISIDRIHVPMEVRVADLVDVVDCGDVPMTYYDNPVALRQLEIANKVIVSKESARSFQGTSLAKDGKFHSRVITLGGDHTITLPLLRGIAELYGPVSVIHFDSHLDTWAPTRMEGGPWLPDEEIPVTHGSYFWYAYNEGLMVNDSNVHVGIRGAISSWKDYEDDRNVGFSIIHADEIEDIGYKGVIKKIRDRVGTNPVYLTFDIDVVEPGMAPAPEIGGYTTREIKKILQGLDGLKIVGADVVEVAPAYDTQDEITQIAAANIAWLIAALMAKNPPVH
ncbi:Arginase/deacetylase [Hysterangium stoloniferum]|nr:Arginase/deacetylase [Hysterangium stoloniferum]